MFRRLRVAFNNRIFTKVGLVILILGALVNLLAFKLPAFQFSANYAIQIMYAYLMLGFIFLVFDNKKLMLVCLFSAGLIAFFLKISMNSKLKLPAANKESKIRVSLNNLSDIDADEEKVFDAILKTNPSIVIFDEFTPEWRSLLDKRIGEKYSWTFSMPRIDPYGLLIYSNVEVINADTFYYEESPILKLFLKDGNRRFNLYTTYMKPPIDASALQHQQGQFKVMSTVIHYDTLPKIVAGYFNLVGWSGELQDFKSTNSLENSRNVYQLSIHGQGRHLFDTPVSHILLSRHFECIRFAVSRADNDEFGIQSVVQFKYPK